MKAADMRACDMCHQPVAGKTRGGNTLDFHRIVIERHFLKPGPIQRHAGLAMMLGSEMLAGVMGTNEDWTVPTVRRELLICQPCAMDRRSLYELTEDDKGRDLGTPEMDEAIKRAEASR